MPSKNPNERSLVASLAAHARWGREENRSAATAPARTAFDQLFLDQANGDPERAAHLRKEHFLRLSLKSAQARRKAKELTSTAQAAEAELAASGSGPNAA